ncbi:MAG TPA: DHA2 family efflux MFS transporter permease subunit [Capsulimonadaceae bacterium]|jgi:DHA2 family multidrug resistance protein
MATAITVSKPTSADIRPVDPVDDFEGEGTAAERWWILIGLIMAAALEILDTTVVNVSLPQMAGSLNASTTEIAWVSTAYILSNVVILPMTAWISGRLGRKKYLLWSIVIFNIARFMCGLSHSLDEIIVWRLIQGAGGAALISTAQSTIVEIFPRKQISLVQSLFSLGLIVTPTIGPSLGGYITDNWSWQTVFFVHVPLGLLSFALVWLFLRDSVHQDKGQAIDVPGMLALAFGLGSLQYVLEEGARYDWFEDATITRLSIVAFVGIVFFIFWELSPRNKVPILDLRVLKDRGLSGAVILSTIIGFAMYGTVFIYPLFAQTILGFNATTTGLTLIPGGIATAVAAMVCGRVMQKNADARVVIAIGISIFMGAMLVLGSLNSQAGEADVQYGLLIRGLGLGMLFIPIQIAAFATLEGRQISQGSAIFNLVRQLGGSFGIAILGTYLTHMTAFHRATLVGNVYGGNPELRDRLHALTGVLHTHGGLAIPQAKQAAMVVMDRLLQKQAVTMAFCDAFLLVLVVCAFVLPAILILKKAAARDIGPVH